MEGVFSLGSGSKGNSLFVGTPKTRLLVDAGLSAKVIKERLAEHSIELTTINAILVTHEHSDHIAGLKTLAFQHKIPIFCNMETARAIVHTFNDCPRFKIFSTGEAFEHADLKITPFSILHDTSDPVAFTFQLNDTKVGVCTDIGFATSLVAHTLKGCHHLFIEANHQPEMVHACARPDTYKQRVLSRTGHLSNAECGALLKQIWHSEIQQITLAHLSSECNSPEAAKKYVQEAFDSALSLVIAPQDAPSAPFFF